MVTWKTDAAPAPDELAPSPYARIWATSLGKGADGLAAAPAAARVRIVARDPEADGAAAAMAAVADEVRATGRDPAPAIAVGDEVLAIVTSPGEPYLIGHYRHAAWRPIDQAATVPADAPSRAYAKIEEAIAWGQLAVAPGQVAVEVGSAPGGAAYALARRGLTVWGVDPGDMDAGVLAYRHGNGGRVQHLRETLASVRWEQLPRAVDWLLVDVNLAPPVALHGVTRLIPAWKRTLRGAVITLKMNDQAMRRALPNAIERMRAMGLAEIHTAHLPSNRAEVCAIGLRARGLAG